ncbi:MAG TPA: hypothetical protein VJH70_01130 [Candidatus Paceibacterota bacterium]
MKLREGIVVSENRLQLSAISHWIRNNFFYLWAFLIASLIFFAIIRQRAVMPIDWRIIVIWWVLFGYWTQPVLIKKIASAPGRARNLVWQYFFSAVFAVIAAMIAKYVFGAVCAWDSKLIFVLILGAFNGFACYCHWRAAAINLAATSVNTWADDVIAMVLGLIVLGEARYLNLQLGIGILFSLSAILLFTFAKTISLKANVAAGEHPAGIQRIALWVACYSLIWGGAMFLMRFFSLKGVPLWEFVPCWYSGSFLGALGVFACAHKEERGDPSTLLQSMGRVMPISLNICISLSMAYWARSLAPITVTQPLLQISEMIFPTLVGLIIFEEHTHFNKLGWLAIAIGLIGGTTIVLSF